ncbi:hypothetical protein LO763_19250 [Glycomyces sp. A-F 0318]|uniref:hypothetical protein n=1 Tax=Glycomyces amatae TaxID=2881355 RepID=UPI001E44EE3D|nr:hypothetical protein [Glycomyces amatae]MCD0445748.1 hypothetical protein [Glycomyces amatae]
MNPETWWTVPGWGLAFAMWALAAACGVAIVLVSVIVSGLVALHRRRRRRAERR